MSSVSTDDPQLHAAVLACVAALRRIAAYSLPAPLDRYVRELGERKEFLSAAEHEQLLALVGFTQQRTLDKLQAELALRQLHPFFPRGDRCVSVVNDAERAAIEDRAEHRCEYCHLPTRGQVATFPIDHPVPRSSGGATEPENLALSCPHCNGHKWAHTTGVDPLTGEAVALFNPRKDCWEDHFRWSMIDWSYPQRQDAMWPGYNQSPANEPSDTGRSPSAPYGTRGFV